ncbi:hypothetical protein AX16_001547 [Volvariella volvacea WC 439]|nr:hypothetical protein AX16_001547 [Volvariella volvacea WC 439]
MDIDLTTTAMDLSPSRPRKLAIYDESDFENDAGTDNEDLPYHQWPASQSEAEDESDEDNGPAAGVLDDIWESEDDLLKDDERDDIIGALSPFQELEEEQKPTKADFYLVRDNAWSETVPLALELTLHTSIRVASLYAIRLQRKRIYYLKDDLEEMEKKLEAYRKDIEAKLPGATEKYEAFIAERKAYVQAVVANAQHGWNWLRIGQGREFRAFERGQNRRREQIKEKCLDNGYLLDDITKALERCVGISDKPLTDKGWSHVRSRFERIINCIEDERSKSQREEIEHRRLLVAKKFWEDYLESLPPKDKLWFPPESWVVSYLKHIMQIAMHTRLKAKVTEENFWAVAEDLPQSIYNLLGKKEKYYTSFLPTNPYLQHRAGREPEKSKLLGLLPSDSQPIGNSDFVFISAWSVTNGSVPQIMLGTVGLTTAIFQYGGKHCTNKSPIFGSNPALIQQKCLQTGQEGCDKTREYWQEASTFARCLVILAGLDSDKAKAKAKNMDNLDVLFGRRMKRRKLAFSWRDADNYLKLARVGDLELGPKSVAVAHAQTKHDVQSPKAYIDILRFPFTSLPPFHASADDEADDEDAPAGTLSPVEALIQERREKLKPPKKYTCNHCRNAQKPRLFNIDGVKSHIKSKHKISAPREGDWSCLG